jgi:hypothetical protein
MLLLVLVAVGSIQKAKKDFEPLLRLGCFLFAILSYAFQSCDLQKRSNDEAPGWLC